MPANAVYGLMGDVPIGKPARKRNTVLNGLINIAALIFRDSIEWKMPDLYNGYAEKNPRSRDNDG